MKPAPTLLSLTLALPLLLLSCTSPSVSIRNRPTDTTATLLFHQSRLSPETRAYLAEKELLGRFRQNPAEAIASVQAQLQETPSVEARTAYIELCTTQAVRLESKNQIKDSVGYHLAAAEAAYDGDALSARGLLTPSYNSSCEEVVRILFDPESPWDQQTTFPGPTQSYHLNLRKNGSDLIDPYFYDELYPANYLEFKHVKLDRNLRSGVGASLVGHRVGTLERLKDNPFLAPSGLSMPVNATLEFSGGNTATLAFRDLTQSSTAVVAGRRVPLAADLSAPLAMLYDYLPKNNVGWGGMLHPENYADKMGLFELQPYQEGKIPVVFVHGLMSSPETWFTTLNLLYDDPEFLKHYQPLAYYYPTGFPIVYSSANLRRDLKDYQQLHNPGGDKKKMGQMVLVGHSMGGLLTSGQIRDSLDILEAEFFTKPLDQINGLTADQKATLESLLVYQANPNISHAVFVAAPHRGSDLAVSSLGKFGNALIHIPLNAVTNKPIPDIDGLTDAGREAISDRPNGINGLDPYAPGIMAVTKEPIRSGITVHSIIGTHHPDDPLEQSTDTVVPYWSSHLDNVASEKVVHAKHTTITGNLDSNEEIRRILYLNAGLRPAP